MIRMMLHRSVQLITPEPPGILHRCLRLIYQAASRFRVEKHQRKELKA
jgi:hypothetical protein